MLPILVQSHALVLMHIKHQFPFSYSFISPSVFLLFGLTLSYSFILPLLLTDKVFHWLAASMCFFIVCIYLFIVVAAWCFAVSQQLSYPLTKTQNPFSLMSEGSLVGVTAVSWCPCVHLQSSGGNCLFNHSIVHFATISHNHIYIEYEAENTQSRWIQLTKRGWLFSWTK